MKCPDSILLAKRPCVKCGATDRYMGGKCKPCTKIACAADYTANRENRLAANAVYRAANPDKLKAYHAAYRAANQEMVKAKKAAYCAVNKEKKKAYNDKWTEAHPDANRIHKQNRRARKLENGGTLSKGLSTKLFKLQKGKCPCCKRPLGNDYHLDHKMPLALGGTNTDDNIQLLRSGCNHKKSAKHPIEYMQSMGFLL